MGEWQQVDDEKDVLKAFRINELYNAKFAEIENWKKYKVFEEVKEEGQTSISVRWGVTEKIKEGVKRIKAWLIAKGFEEKQEMITESPTCSKDFLRLQNFLVSSFGWKCNSLDINATYFQGKSFNREIYLKAPKEFYNGQLWLLKKTIYGLGNVTRAWYLKLKEVLLEAETKISKLDPAFFYLNADAELLGIVCIHVDDIFWSGTEKFASKFVESIKESFSIWAYNADTFKYIGLNIEHKKTGLKLINKIT